MRRQLGSAEGLRVSSQHRHSQARLLPHPHLSPVCGKGMALLIYPMGKAFLLVQRALR